MSGSGFSAVQIDRFTLFRPFQFPDFLAD